MSQMQSHLSAVTELAARARGLSWSASDCPRSTRSGASKGCLPAAARRSGVSNIPRSAAAWQRMRRWPRRGSALRQRSGGAAARMPPAGMRDALANEGVDVRHFRLFSGGRSSVSGIIVDRSGERQIVNFRGQFPLEPTGFRSTSLPAPPRCLPIRAGPRAPSRCSARRGRSASRRCWMATSPIQRVRAIAAADRSCGVFRASA